MIMYNDTVKAVLKECESVLYAIPEKDTEEFIRILNDANSIFFVGVGRVLLSLKAFAKRLAHLGFDTHIVGEITEPAIKKGDVIIVGSGSGESMFPRLIAEKAKSFGATVVMIGSNRESSIAKLSDFMIRVPTNTKLQREDEIKSEQIMTSLFEQFLLLYGDIVAKMIVDKNNVDMHSLWQYHANLE